MVLAAKLKMPLQEATASIHTLSDVEGLCVAYASTRGSSSPLVAVEVGLSIPYKKHSSLCFAFCRFSFHLFFGFTRSIVLLEFQLVDFASIYLSGLHVQFVHWNYLDWYNN